LNKDGEIIDKRTMSHHRFFFSLVHFTLFVDHRSNNLTLLDWFSKVRAAKGDFWGIEVGTGGNLTCQSDNSDSIRFTSATV